MDLNSLEEDLSRLLSAEGNGVGFPAVASSEYKLRTTVSCMAILSNLTFLLLVFPFLHFYFL